MEPLRANSRSSARRLRPRESSSAPTGPGGLCGPAPSATGRRKAAESVNWHRVVQLSSMTVAARLPTFFSATSRPRSSSELSSENTFFICPECFRKAETMRSLPRGVRATIRTRRSSALSTRLTRPFATRRSTAILIEPGVRSTTGPIVLTGKGPFAQQEFQHAEIREAESGLFNTSGCVPCQGAHRLHHYYPDVVRHASGHKNLNLPEAYIINSIDINIRDANTLAPIEKENPVMKTASVIARYLAGVIFLVMGLNGFLNFIPIPPPRGIAGQFMGALYVSHYLWVIFAFQVIAAVLLLVNRYVPLAVAVLAPVIVNILVFHALMAPSGLPLALFVAVLWAVIFFDVQPAFAGLFQSRLQAQA